ncbi:MAG: class II aldolase/adducin family protein, partial [Opitutales bacterium]
MNKVITAKDIDGYIAAGRDPLTAIPAGAIVTPAARDRLREAGATLGGSRGPATAKKSTAPALPDYEFHWEPGSDPKTPAEVEAFFRSPQVCEVKERIVDIGRRIWERDYVDGNGGNLTIRVGDNLVLCTPTLISKGFMQVEDICLVDLEGTQLAGSRPRTSEVMTHIGIMKQEPKAKSCVHAHPVHATAFAVASVKPPT